MNDLVQRLSQEQEIEVSLRPKPTVQAFKAALTQRGLTELSYAPDGQPMGEAPDIGYAWRQAQMQFVNQSVGFGQLFNRYLDGDNLQ